MTLMNSPMLPELVTRERDILARIAEGGPLKEVLRDLVLLVEKPSEGQMLASVLFLSPDGKNLLEGAAPSLPDEYNAAINGIPIGPNVGSCGTAAFEGQTVIVSDIANDPLWANFRDLALKHGLQACWSVPIKGADGKTLGTYANYYREPRTPTDRDMEIISMVARTTGIAIDRHRHELARQRSEEQRTLLLQELNHRVKNVFALASSLISLGARNTSDAQELAASVQQRLSALSRAHQLVQPSLSKGADNAPAPTFRKIIDDILAPYATDGFSNRVALSGPDFVLQPNAITGVALVLHELATNAVKYGCLREGDGALSIVWTMDHDKLRLIWNESGFSCKGPPTQSGFGSTLTKSAVERQFGGTIQHDWRSDGLSVTIELPLSAMCPPPS